MVEGSRGVWGFEVVELGAGPGTFSWVRRSFVQARPARFPKLPAKPRHTIRPLQIVGKPCLLFKIAESSKLSLITLSFPPQTARPRARFSPCQGEVRWYRAEGETGPTDVSTVIHLCLAHHWLAAVELSHQGERVSISTSTSNRQVI